MWAELRQKGAFQTALVELDQREPLRKVLRETCGVHSDFLAMLVARDLIVLLPHLVSQDDVDACTVVGEGAESTLVECTDGRNDGKWHCSNRKGVKQRKWHYSAACKKTFHERLNQLHQSLVELLDERLLQLVVPQGWTLDLTENACCELRRWDKAKMHRKRGGDSEERQRNRLVQLRATWQLLGFTVLPRCLD